MECIEPLEDHHWGQQAEQAFKTSTAIGTEQFTQEMKRFADREQQILEFIDFLAARSKDLQTFLITSLGK